MRRYFPRQRDGTFAGRSEEVVASAGRRTGRPTRRSNADASASLSTSKEQAETVPASEIGWICTAKWYKLKKVGYIFFIEPPTVMKGEVGEQVSMFIEDPDGHAIEFKAFEGGGDLFRKARRRGERSDAS